MDNQWKEENCGNCNFRIGDECRKNPPMLYSTRQHHSGELTSYSSPARYEYPEVIRFQLRESNSPRPFD